MKTIFELFPKLPYLAIGLCAYIGCTDSGHNIEIKIDGLRKSMVYLGYYEGSNPYIRDSTIVDSKGKARFKGNQNLRKGVYFLYSKERNFSFDFVVTDSKVSLKTSSKNPLEKLEDLESGDNTIFFQFRKEINDFRKDMEHSGQLLVSAQDKKDSLGYVIRMKNRELELLESQKSMISKYENTTIGYILQYMRLPEQPTLYPEQWEEPKYQKKRNLFYREHFFDHLNFNDSLLLRVPILKYRLHEFFDHVVEQQPDSIIKAMDEMMLKTRVNKAVYKQTLMELTYKYIAPPILDQDKAFVHFADTYLLTQETLNWINTNMYEHISNITEKMRPNTTGKKAPSLRLNTLNGKEIDLYSLNAKNMILFFYDPECDHCIVESKKIRSNYKDLKNKDIEIMGICISPDSEKCKQYASDYNINWVNVLGSKNNTGYREKYNIFAAPILFLLDHKKRIIAKATNFDQITRQLP